MEAKWRLYSTSQIAVKSSWARSELPHGRRRWYVRSGAAALAPLTLYIPFLDPNPAISDSWIPIHIAGKIPRSGGAVLQDLDVSQPQLMPLKI